MVELCYLNGSTTLDCKVKPAELERDLLGRVYTTPNEVLGNVSKWLLCRFQILRVP